MAASTVTKNSKRLVPSSSIPKDNRLIVKTSTQSGLQSLPTEGEATSKNNKKQTATLYGLIKVAKKLKLNLEDASASSLLITNTQTISSNHDKTPYQHSHVMSKRNTANAICSSDLPETLLISNSSYGSSPAFAKTQKQQQFTSKTTFPSTAILKTKDKTFKTAESFKVSKEDTKRSIIELDPILNKQAVFQQRK